MSDNKYIQKAEEELEYLTGDEEAKRLAYLREKSIRDEQSALIVATRNGIAKGENNKKIEIARKMLAKNMDINLIVLNLPVFLKKKLKICNQEVL